MALAAAKKFTPEQGLGAMTGNRYIESLKDGREVWIDGKRVDDVTTHPAFRRAPVHRSSACRAEIM